jgi:predicted metal-dependent phosphoesterase TrpH
LDSGHVESISEAFSLYLSSGAPGYIEKAELPPGEATRLIRRAGGVPVLAHPTTLKLSGSKLEACVEHLAGQGLAGIEVYWPKHTEAEKASYERLGARLNLVATMGSDFHGSNKPAIELGMGFTEGVDVDQMLLALRSKAGTKCSGHQVVEQTVGVDQPPNKLVKRQVAG